MPMRSFVTARRPIELHVLRSLLYLCLYCALFAYRRSDGMWLLLTAVCQIKHTAKQISFALCSKTVIQPCGDKVHQHTSPISEPGAAQEKILELVLLTTDVVDQVTENPGTMYNLVGCRRKILSLLPITRISHSVSLAPAF